MTPETTISIQAVLLITTALIGILTFINSRKKDIQKETQEQQSAYLSINKDITKLGVKIDTFGGDIRDLKTDVREINDQMKEINERTIRQDGRMDKQEERLNQIEKRVDALEREERN